MNPFAEIYNRPEVVDAFRSDALDKSESVLLLELLQRREPLAMLDLGVGAGRTTEAFSRTVQRYVGIDHAPRMIAACRERFGARTGCTFEVGEAAALAHLPDASFDVVLFSFNGIDCLPPNGRAECLRAVRRVLRQGGTFFFSSHNLQAIPRYFEGSPSGGAPKFAINAERRARILRHNEHPASYAKHECALFWDGVYDDDGTLRHVYVQPRHQLCALTDVGFANAHAISTITGERIAEATLQAVSDLSVAYWCESPAG